MPAPTKRFAALDTTFLLSLAAGDEACEETIDWFGAINVYPVVTGTVLQELADIEQNEEDPFVLENASKALANIPVWGFLSIPLQPAENGIAKVIANKLADKGFLPDEYENDGLVVAEAAFQNCNILVTYRQTLLDCSGEGLKFMLLENDVADLFIVSPVDVVEYLEGQKKKAPTAPKKPSSSTI
jgi:hypothetical protein